MSSVDPQNPSPDIEPQPGKPLPPFPPPPPLGGKEGHPQSAGGQKSKQTADPKEKPSAKEPAGPEDEDEDEEENPERSPRPAEREGAGNDVKQAVPRDPERPPNPEQDDDGEDLDETRRAQRPER